jgi:hypothetical protein
VTSLMRFWADVKALSCCVALWHLSPTEERGKQTSHNTGPTARSFGGARDAVDGRVGEEAPHSGLARLWVARSSVRASGSN